jgi:hypothetical protein
MNSLAGVQHSLSSTDSPCCYFPKGVIVKHEFLCYQV